jgi:hypothetical protein
MLSSENSILESAVATMEHSNGKFNSEVLFLQSQLDRIKETNEVSFYLSFFADYALLIAIGK